MHDQAIECTTVMQLVLYQAHAIQVHLMQCPDALMQVQFIMCSRHKGTYCIFLFPIQVVVYLLHAQQACLMYGGNFPAQS